MAAPVQKATSGGTATLLLGISLAYASNVTKNNLLIAVVGNGGAGDAGSIATVPTDTEGNVWTLAKGQVGIDGFSFVAIYFAIAGSTGANTVTWNGGGFSDLMMVIFEYAGPSASPLDQTNSNVGAATGSVTTLQAMELVFGAITSANLVSGWDASAGFTIEEAADNAGGGNASLGTADLSVSNTGTYSTTFSGSGLAPDAAAIASFKLGAAPVTPTKLEISLFGVKRFGKPPEVECKELPVPPGFKRVM